jgi:uncharacterized membrane protein YbhN (UPF0104 family)
MKATAKRALLLVVSLAVSAVAIVWFVRTMSGHWEAMGEAFARADYVWLVPAVGCIALSYVFRILRWRLFLRPVARVEFGALTSATLIGFMSTAVLPLRAGEVIRPFVLHRKSGISFGHAVGSDAGLARVFDMLFGLGFLFLLAWGWLMVEPDALGAGASPAAGSELLAERLRVLATSPAFAALFAASLVGLVTVAAFPGIVLRVGEAFLRPLPPSWQEPLTGFLRSVVESLQFLRRPLPTAGAVLLTMAVWLTYPAAAWCVARGFGAELGLLGLVVIQVMIMVAIIVPQAPGFLGVFQVAAMEGARLFGAADGPAGAFALVLWAIHTMPITVVGLGYLWYEGLSLKGLARASRAVAERTEGALEAHGGDGEG